MQMERVGWKAARPGPGGGGDGQAPGERIIESSLPPLYQIQRKEKDRKAERENRDR